MWRDPRVASRGNRDRSFAYCAPPILPRFFAPLYHWLADPAQVTMVPILRHFRRQRHHATNATSEARVSNMQVREHGTGDAMDEAVFSGRESGAGKIEDSQALRRN